MEERQRNSASTEGKAARMGWPIHCLSPEWCLLKECHMTKQAEWFGISNVSISLFFFWVFSTLVTSPVFHSFHPKGWLVCLCSIRGPFLFQLAHRSIPMFGESYLTCQLFLAISATAQYSKGSSFRIFYSSSYIRV